MKTVYGIAIFITVFILFVTGFALVGTDIATNGKSNLNNDSVLYIAQYNGYQADKFQVLQLQEDADLFNTQDNSSGEPTVDFAQEFLFSVKSSQKSQQYVSTIVNVPDFLVLTFNQEETNWAPYLIIIGSFITVTLVVAFYLFIKGRATED